MESIRYSVNVVHFLRRNEIHPRTALDLPVAVQGDGPLTGEWQIDRRFDQVLQIEHHLKIRLREVITRLFADFFAGVINISLAIVDGVVVVALNVTSASAE